jgi:hypothetical protein
VVEVHTVQDAGIAADVLVDDVQPQEGGERRLGAGAEPHGPLVRSAGGAEDLAVGTRGVPQAAHLQHEGADTGLAEAEGGHGAAVAGADDDRRGGFDRVGLGGPGGLEVDAGESEGGRRLEGDHAEDLTSRQMMVRQFPCHARTIDGFSASG